MKKLFFAFGFSLFAFLCSAQYRVLHVFNGTTGGYAGFGSGSLFSDGTYLYGVTLAGGANTGISGCGSIGFGTIFKIMPNGTGFDTLTSFNSTMGGNPQFSSLITDGTYLYGMTSAGNPACGGSVFKIMPNGTGFDTLITFDCINGCSPSGSLVYDGTYLYGMTNIGSGVGAGVVFKIKPNGSNFSVLLTMDGTVGDNPYGSLIIDGGYLYGMTETAGGASGNSFGTIFKIDTNGTGYQNLHVFNDTTGAYPYGSLLQYKDYLYGMTQGGGAYNSGVIFKIKTDGTVYDTLFSFDNTDGGNPYGSLIAIGSQLYGMTKSGGSDYEGVIFKIDTTGKGYTNLYNFKDSGTNPYGSLIFISPYLYGMTSSGGSSGNYGVIFRMDTNIATAINTVKNESEATNLYPNPNKGRFLIKVSGIGSNSFIEVYNMLGQNIYQTKLNTGNTEINLSNQPEGIYLYRVNTMSGVLIGEGKIVIEH